MGTRQSKYFETAELVNRRFVAHTGLEAKSVVGHIGDAPHEDLLFARRRFLIPYLQFIQENQQLFSAMVKRPGPSSKRRVRGRRQWQQRRQRELPTATKVGNRGEETGFSAANWGFVDG